MFFEFEALDVDLSGPQSDAEFFGVDILNKISDDLFQQFLQVFLKHSTILTLYMSVYVKTCRQI